MPDAATQTPAAPLPPLILLSRVTALQAWRRLRSVRDQSKLLTAFIVAFLGGYLALSFFLFHRGLAFLSSFPGLGALLAERLLYLLFAFLFGLLLLSNLIIGYTTFFRNRETAFLLALPVSWQTIFRWKLLESTLLASWAFVFLIAPLLLAFGLNRHVAWHFYLATPVLLALFLALPGAAGAWLAILLARHLDRRTFQIGLLGAATLLLLAAAFWWKAQPVPEELLETRTLEVLDRLLVKTHFALFPFLPSYWLSTSVLQWAEGALAAAAFFALVLLSHVLFFGLLTLTRLGRVFYDTSSTVLSRASVLDAWTGLRSRRQRHGSSTPHLGFLERLFCLLPFVPQDARALLVKDLRAFWRDTTQWGQSVMLFGLLGVYILNLRHFTHQFDSLFWVNLVSYLNLAACALNLATVTTRFVYPQFSLEGPRLWIVGLAPLGLERVVLLKYWLATTLSLFVTLGLNLLSCQFLKLPWHRTLLFAGVVALMTFTLNGLAVGLGVLYPNFKETNPSKIVSGFGGTLCLILSFLYILASVLLVAVGTAPLGWRLPSLPPALACVAGFFALSLLIGWLPLRLALHRIRRFEL